MRQDKLTAKFQAALADAQSLALGRDHQIVEPAHLLLALLDSSDGTVRPLLMKAGADVNKLRSELGALLDKLPKVKGTAGGVHISNDIGRHVHVTDKVDQKSGELYIPSEFYVFAAFEDKGPLARVLKDCGVVRGAVDKAN